MGVNVGSVVVEWRISAEPATRLMWALRKCKHQVSCPGGVLLPCKTSTRNFQPWCRNEGCVADGVGVDVGSGGG
jgi:hypothetical protein